MTDAEALDTKSLDTKALDTKALDTKALDTKALDAEALDAEALDTEALDTKALPDRASRRLDQWLWFARVVKSRSQAARLCVSGEIVVNGAMVIRARHRIRAGDRVVLPQATLGRELLGRELTVLSLGTRRGPAGEARLLYRERAAPVPLSRRAPAWVPLLADEEAGNQN